MSINKFEKQSYLLCTRFPMCHAQKLFLVQAKYRNRMLQAHNRQQAWQEDW